MADEAITGDALVALVHSDLKEMGINSIGHRLTILKGIYDVKVKQNVPIEPDHYLPLSKSLRQRVLRTCYLTSLKLPNPTSKMFHLHKMTSPELSTLSKTETRNSVLYEMIWYAWQKKIANYGKISYLWSR